MGTENSSEETRARAKKLANEIGRFIAYAVIAWLVYSSLSYHLDINIDNVVGSVLTLFTLATKEVPQFMVTSHECYGWLGFTSTFVGQWWNTWGRLGTAEHSGAPGLCRLLM